MPARLAVSAGLRVAAGTSAGLAAVWAKLCRGCPAVTLYPMFSYRHGFHAGNHADVLKHIVLVQLLKHLNAKD